MKDNLRFIMLLALVTFLCNGFVSATDSGNVAEDKIANETMQLRLSFVSAPSQNDQVKLADIKATLPPEIQQSLEEQMTFNESVIEAIAEKEELLVRSPLIINDSYDITGEAQSFFVGNITTSLEPAPLGTELFKENITSSAGILPVNQIPNGGFIEFGSDGKTRVFTPEGTQISYAVDNRSENVTTPSGKILPSTHIIGLPNGAARHLRGNREYITMKGEVILTIIDQPSKETLGDSIIPSTLSYPWVEYAESDPYYIAAVHSNWIIPHSPNLGTNATYANILFNGVEPSDGSMIFQPVTAFNFYPHSLIIGPGNRTDPAIVNKWTGASWICSNLDYCTHSTPTLVFSEGELAYGAIFWYEAPVLKWLVYLVNGSNQGTWLWSDPYIYTQPSRAVITYEFAGSYPLGERPHDKQKISNTTFSNISVWDTIGNQITTLHWNGFVNHKDHTKTTGLNVDLSQAPSTVTLETDYNGSRIAVYKDGSWYIDVNGDGVWNTGDRNAGFGAPSWLPVVGDWNGDGISEIGTYRDGAWYLDYDNSGSWNTGDKNYGFGAAGWTPVIGDWNGDGYAEIGTYKDGAWYLDYDNSGTWNSADKNYVFGSAGWSPVIGDWNADGKDKIGIYLNGIYYIDYSGDGSYGAGDPMFSLGMTGSNPVTGDWNNNAQSKVGTHTGNVWKLDYDGSYTWNTSDKTYVFGSAGWLPVIGDWNADGKDKIGIYLNGAWYLDANGNGVWDAGSDKNYAFGTTGWTPVIGKWI